MYDTGLDIELSDEQNAVITHVLAGRDVIVDAAIGSGKTSTINALCNVYSAERDDARILYLTYSKLLKIEAQAKITRARVQNYHGYVYPFLQQAGISSSVSDSIRQFNRNFDALIRDLVPAYDLLVIDEYQDIRDEFAQLLRNIKSVNPAVQVVMVGDMSQKVSDVTTLDAAEFAREFTDNAIHLPFTQSFRMGPEMAERLGEAWNKPIIGVNASQKVSYLSQRDAVQKLRNLARDGRHGDILCLGARNGQLANVLNDLESKTPQLFNKHNTYATISESGTGVNYGADTAVFTTFDGSKGMEREVCFVFGYDSAYWEIRANREGVDPEIMRNIFLVAASRGKGEIVFVEPWRNRKTGMVPRKADHGVGYLPMATFTKLAARRKPVYKLERPMGTRTMFSFVYAENVQRCYEMLELERLDDGMEDVIDIQSRDALIDLSPVLDTYQQSVFFDDFDVMGRLHGLSTEAGEIFGSLMDAVHELVLAQYHEQIKAGTRRPDDLAMPKLDPWTSALYLAAAQTGQRRYATQVEAKPDTVAMAQLQARIGTFVDATAPSQVKLDLVGTAVDPASGKDTPLRIATSLDTTIEAEDRIVKIRYAEELGQPDFAELGMQLCMAETYTSGLLLNTRTGERWTVRVPDRQAYLDAAVTCATKQAYRTFEVDEVIGD